jgi:5-methylcytosine-specific restriction endonuclease McrA
LGGVFKYRNGYYEILAEGGKMAKVNKKMENYVNKLYRGKLPKLKEKIKAEKSLLVRTGILIYEGDDVKGKRITTSSSQGKKVVIDCKRKCVICAKKIDGDSSDFEIHHVNGDRAKTYTSNLVLLCHSCHKKVHTLAIAKLKDYEIRFKTKKSIK